ncbi:MAG: hypothetical protein ACTSXA_01340 [Candidatus Heimdallarchaeota archaeon]
MNTIIANRIYSLVAHDSAKIAILNLLSDGNWHTRFEIESIAKDQRPTIGFVGICTILKSLQDADIELLEVYDNDSGRFFKINPQRIEMIKRIVSHKMRTTKDAGAGLSAPEFKLFRDKLRNSRKSNQTQDDDLKHFL